MSEKTSQAQASTARISAPARGKLTLLNALIILAIIYLVCEIIPLFATIIARPLIPWIELGQWILLAIWFLVGVRPPLMEWIRRDKARKEQ